MDNKARYTTIDEYIATLPANRQRILGELRAIIKAAAPDAEETISYQMPAFKLKGTLVYFASAKNHIGFYPTSSGVEAFKDELAEYGFSKGAIRLPVDRPLPADLITRIVQHRVSANLEKAAAKSRKKK